MKPLFFQGDTRAALQEFAAGARRKIGFELRRLQAGLQPHDSKPIKAVGPGVEEIRVWAESGTYRVIYIARFEEAIYVLHAFQKKTQETSQRDLELARKRYEQLLRTRPE